MDGFNTFFQPSNCPSFRYANNKHYKGFVPPYDIALCRLLMKFDGHFIRNGVKVTATSHYRLFNHTMKPSEIKFPDGYHQQVSNLALNDFRNAMKYYNITNWFQNRYSREY
jgi:small subunit ribosomal protein S29